MTTSRAAPLSVGLADRFFSAEEIERARRYHRPLYLSIGATTVLSLGYLAVLSFSPLGGWLAEPFDGLPRWAFAMSYAAVVVVVGTLLTLPISYWRGYVHEHRWEFSTQRLSSWVADWAKGLAVTVVLLSLVLSAFLEIAAIVHRSWPLVVAPVAVVLVVTLSFVAPVIFEPIFNKFRPLEDAELAAQLHAIAKRARTPVKEVLVADASRRTKKENAYVSGLGKTRRVVVYDTLLTRGSPRDVRLVVAHELGHRRDRHVAIVTVLAVVGSIVAVVIVWALLQSHGVLSAIGASGPADPRVIPFVLLVLNAMGLVSMPLGAAFSRRLEASADRISIELTGDPEGFAEMERDLAIRNLIDLDPPRALYLMMFTHPSPPERIAASAIEGRSTTE